MTETIETTELRIDTELLTTEVKQAVKVLGGLRRVLASVEAGVRDAFRISGLKDYQKTVTRFGKALTDQLLVLQLSFGKMKYAIADAAAPLASVFVPMINSAIQAVIRFSGVVGQFLQGVIAGITGNTDLANSADQAAEAEEKLETAAKAAGKAVRRSLAGFDQIQRLNGGSGSGGSSSADSLGTYTPDVILPQVQAVVDRVLEILAPLLNIDMTPLQTALQSLTTAFSNMATVAGEGLSFLWFEILTPFVAWMLETLAPALTEAFAAKLELVTASMAPVAEGLQILWEALTPVVDFIGQMVITTLENWRQHFVRLADVYREKHPVILEIFQNISQLATQVWAVVGPVLNNLATYFSQTFAGISEMVGTAVGYILEMFRGITQFLAGAFTGNWEKAWGGVCLFLKSVVNGIITLLNGMITQLVNALNAVVSVANRLSFTVPDWVPSFGGRKFGVSLPYVSAPQIPYLAKGAVLPAGKPFLAMVGDQTHGTNIEAPLATIQEAVALVMEEQTGAILRGFEASVGVQREILQAVLGIHIGDEVIGQAVSRYQRRMAVVRGG